MGLQKEEFYLAIGKKFKLPILALGMGEKEDDLTSLSMLNILQKQ